MSAEPKRREVARALILAGGLGTRLRPVLGERPKALAPVGAETFLDLQVAWLAGAGFRRLGLLLGHGHQAIVAHLATLRARHPELTIDTSIEPTPLGTGGALRHAAGLLDATAVLLNGDTWIELDAPALLAAHRRTGAAVTIAARQVADAGRYGRLETGDGGRVTALREKGAQGPGLVNAGVYVIEPALLAFVPEGVSSLERDVLPAAIAAGAAVHAAVQDLDFIDIGTEDGYRAFTSERTDPR